MSPTCDATSVSPDPTLSLKHLRCAPKPGLVWSLRPSSHRAVASLPPSESVLGPAGPWGLFARRQLWFPGQDESQQSRASGPSLGQIRCPSRGRCGGHKTAYLLAQWPSYRKGRQEDSLGGPWLQVRAARWVLTGSGTGGGASGLQLSPMEGSWGHRVVVAGCRHMHVCRSHGACCLSRTGWGWPLLPQEWGQGLPEALGLLYLWVGSRQVELFQEGAVLCAQHPAPPSWPWLSLVAGMGPYLPQLLPGLGI